MIKADWDMAYKHVSVCWADHNLQVIEFDRRCFIEKCLTFGGGSSPTLYHMPASLLITMAEEATGFPHCQSLMQLDDNCCVDGKGSLRLRAYRKAYRSLAEEVGVRLASEENPLKIPTGLYRMLVLLGTGIKQGYLTNGEAMSSLGKLNHYSPVVQGKFERCLITHLVDDGQPKDLRVKVPRQTIFAMVWWLLNLPASLVAWRVLSFRIRHNTSREELWNCSGMLRVEPPPAR